IMGQIQPFIPTDFKVPNSLQNEHFRIRMLTVNDIVKDYDAVMSSIEHLKEMYPLSTWPSKDFTFEQNLIDLGWHQKEFQNRTSFAYTVVSLDESQIIGALYIKPIAIRDYDASVTMWVRTSVVKDGLDAILFDSVKKWISKDWPFQKVAYPGREINWNEWESMKQN
ncbi:MAG: GNAT family N-acetyltransferase, partial [Saprospiraceae bacterium]